MELHTDPRRSLIYCIESVFDQEHGLLEDVEYPIIPQFDSDKLAVVLLCKAGKLELASGAFFWSRNSERHSSNFHLLEEEMDDLPLLLGNITLEECVDVLAGQLNKLCDSSNIMCHDYISCYEWAFKCLHKLGYVSTENHINYKWTEKSKYYSSEKKQVWRWSHNGVLSKQWACTWQELYENTGFGAVGDKPYEVHGSIGVLV